jgi:hypothetical protein
MGRTKEGKAWLTMSSVVLSSISCLGLRQITESLASGRPAVEERAVQKAWGLKEGAFSFLSNS